MPTVGVGPINHGVYVVGVATATAASVGLMGVDALLKLYRRDFLESVTIESTAGSRVP